MTQPAPADVIDCRNLIKIHKQGKLEVVALHGVDLQVAQGEFAAVVGTSGAGKSSLLQIIAGLDVPSAGSVVVADVDLVEAQGRLTDHYRHGVGFLWQDFRRNLVPYLNAVQNIELPLMLAGIGGRQRRQKGHELLEAVGLEDRAHASISTMSGGEQQRLALCVALALEPRLLLADEPTGELDTASTLRIYDLLRSMNRDAGLSILLVTHDVALAQRCDRVIRLADGKVAADNDHGAAVAVEIGHGGAVPVPRDMLLRAGIGDDAVVRLTDKGILLEPGSHEDRGGDDE